MPYRLQIFKLWLGLLVISLVGVFGWHWQSLQVDYSSLEILLVERKWAEADLETSRIINRIILREIDAQMFFGYSLLNIPDGRKFKIANGGLPCADLRTLDQLWSLQSGGQFGFSAQLQIALTVPGYPDKINEISGNFEQVIGWTWAYNDRPSLHLDWYRHIQKLESTKGFLPSNLWALDIRTEKPIETSAVLKTLHHFQTCKNQNMIFE